MSSSHGLCPHKPYPHLCLGLSDSFSMDGDAPDITISSTSIAVWACRRLLNFLSASKSTQKHCASRRPAVRFYLSISCQKPSRYKG